jgi:hypothetical protein
MIDMASVYAERFKQNPQALQAAVMGQSPDPKLDPYTALNALRLIKEASMMAMAGQAQQPTSSPSIVAETMAPPAMPRGLGAMVPGAMGQGPQGMPPQGQAPQGMPPQAPMQAASGGLAGMYTPEEDYAAGGIVAFDEGGKTDDGEDNMIPYAAMFDSTRGANPLFQSEGDPKTYGKMASQYPGAIEDIRNVKYDSITPEQYEGIVTTDMAKMKTAMGGGNLYKQLLADMQSRDDERAGVLEEGKGVALLKAAAAMAQGGNWVRAFANAGAEFGTEYTRALQADKAEKRSIALAKFNIADAERKENMGLLKEARQSGDRAVAANAAAQKAKLDKARAVADALYKGMNATKPLKSAFSGAGAGGPKLPQVDRDAAEITKQIIALEAKNPDDPKIAILKKQREGLMEIISTGKDMGPTKAAMATSQLTAKQNNAVEANMKIWDGGYEARKAKAAGTYDEVRNAKKEAFRQDALRGVFDDEGGASTPTNKSKVIKLD